MDNLEQYWLIFAQIVALAAMIAPLTGSKSDDKIVSILKKIVNTVGFNIGKAKNADDK